MSGCCDGFAPPAGGSGGGGTGIGGVDVEEEGAPLAGNPYQTLNFTGVGVTATDAGGGVADINIPGGFSALDEGAPLPANPYATLNVIGGGASIADVAGVATLNVPAPPPVEIAIEDEGVAQGNASTLDVVGGGASIAVAGATATLTVPAGAGLAESPFGSGIDGDITFGAASPVVFGSGIGAQSLAISGSVYTLTRDVFARNLTIDAGIEVRTNGYGIFVSETLTVNGTLGERSGNGGNGNPGAAGAGGAGGAAIHSDTARRYWGGVAGGGGGAGDAGTGVGGGSGLGSSPAFLTAAAGAGAAGSNGGTLQGGGGGANSAGTAGATVAANTYTIATSPSANSLANAISGRTLAGGTAQFQTGSSGGGGRGAPSNLGGGAGGGGGNGIPVGIFARFITGVGTIRSIGGNGGNGNGSAGGGGGGCGGLLLICTQSPTPLVGVTVSVAGGAAGAAGGGGASTPGGTGGAGVVNYFKP